MVTVTGRRRTADLGLR